MKTHLARIAPHELTAVFPLIHDHIMRGIRQSDGVYDVGSFCELVAEGKWLLWAIYTRSDETEAPAFKAVVATELYHEPSGMLTAAVTFAGGFEANEWAVEALEFLEGWARDSGAERFLIVGRKGWARILRDYKLKQIVLEKRLERRDGKPVRRLEEDRHADAAA